MKLSAGAAAGRRGRVVCGRRLDLVGRRRPRRGAIQTLAQTVVPTFDQQPDVSQQILGADSQLAKLSEIQLEGVGG